MEKRSLRERLLAFGLEADAAERLASYGMAVLDANTRFNLTGAKTAEHIFEQIASSLTLLPYAQGPLADLGSGAGFPAVPIAIAGGLAVTMIESNAKKALFLRRTAETLGLRFEIRCERAETAAHREGLREAFVSASARAVASVTTAIELVLPFVEVGGLAILPRGRLSKAERDALADAAMILGGELEAVHAAKTGGEIALVRKRNRTPQRFPRRTGIPAKRPLCDVSRETSRNSNGRLRVVNQNAETQITDIS
ncbi:MAG: 16S rRNA (guanine(527)-N(7))-methyltransferase RsmG [Candidatus Tyrphobacter sp.]